MYDKDKVKKYVKRFLGQIRKNCTYEETMVIAIMILAQIRMYNVDGNGDPQELYSYLDTVNDGLLAACLKADELVREKRVA